MNLIATDEYVAYPDAILQACGIEVVPERTGKPGRPAAPYQVPPPNPTYTTLHKTLKKWRVVKIDCRVVFGTVVAVLVALAMSLVSKAVKTSFVEWHNGTDRNRNARKVLQSYCFSKDTQVHESFTYFTMYSYNFCGPVRTMPGSGDYNAAVAAEGPSHGGRIDGSCLVIGGVDCPTECSTEVGRQGFSGTTT